MRARRPLSARHRRARAFALGIATFAGAASSATLSHADTLPYSARTKPYSAGETTVRGDIRTVGMAGATTGLADTFIASVDNPSGLAMTVDVGDDTFTNNNIHDSSIQNYDNAMTSNFIGFALAPYPWGFGLGYVSDYQEGQPYTIPGASTTSQAPLQVVTREMQFSASHVFLGDRLSLGATFRLGQAEEDLDLGSNPMTAAYHSYAFGGTFGAMWQFPKRWLFGVSYATSMHYSVDAASVPPTLLPGFFQPVDAPSRTSFGVGWIPNRFFRASMSATLIGESPGTALLRNQDTPVGINPAWEPRLGASYVFVDFKELKGTVFSGTYYEFTRVQGEPNRLHGTAGIELKPWIFTLGWGVDGARDYENYLFSISVDVFKVMAKLDIIPTAWHPAYTGFLHDPLTSSDTGLARPLVKEWRQHGPEINPIDIGLNIPQRIGEKFGEASESLGSMWNSMTGTGDYQLITPDAETEGGGPKLGVVTPDALTESGNSTGKGKSAKKRHASSKKKNKRKAKKTPPPPVSP